MITMPDKGCLNIDTVIVNKLLFYYNIIYLYFILKNSCKVVIFTIRVLNKLLSLS